MKLPRSNEAIIPDQKITHYLLSEAHPVGKAKAKYFRALGYNEEDAGQLKEGLLAVASDGMVVEVTGTHFGTKYIIEGDLFSPSGTRTRVRTIWILETGQSVPRFVTAYPKGE